MKICVPSDGQTIDSQVDPKFGRASFFLILDTDTMEFQVLPNEGLNSASGAGITAAKITVDSGAKALLTGNCGPNAHRILNATNIQVFTGLYGTVKEAVDMFNAGKLSPSQTPTVGPHSGMNYQAQ
jgi:predicted Fe-Mo cluster-binding NifX family protein